MLPEVLSHALNTKALLYHERVHESRALLREALDIALEHDLVPAALRAYNNLLVGLGMMDRREERLRMEVEALDLARRRGNRQFTVAFAGMRSMSLLSNGDWDGAFALAEEWLPAEPTAQSGQALFTAWLAWAALERGERDEARRLLHLIAPGMDDTSDLQLRSVLIFRGMLLAIDEGRVDDVVSATAEEAQVLIVMGHPLQVAATVGIALDTVQQTGDVSALLPLIDIADAASAAKRARKLEAEIGRVRGVAASLAGDHDDAADHFGKALSAARNLDENLDTARVLAEYARALASAGRVDEAEPLADEARKLFVQMGAVRALERLDAGVPARATA
jgi:tetratricopeptide (TPR) repeat protein